MTDLMPSRLSRPVVIGLVGGIASGKSYVGGLLESLGAKRIDADRLGHEVLLKKDIRERLTQIWGPGILTEQGEIDRAKVGKLVFGDSFNAVAQRKQLEAIVLPRIRSLALEQMSALRSLPVLPLAIVIDAPLLIEAGWEPCATLYCSSIRRLRNALREPPREAGLNLTSPLVKPVKSRSMKTEPCNTYLRQQLPSGCRSAGQSVLARVGTACSEGVNLPVFKK